ncbi:MAG: hypothetical protein AB4368_09975 [Xenococcaceae cyanobacterium]
MSDLPSQLSPEERQEWLSKIQTANRNNIFCHCRRCGKEWIDSTFEANCSCGSSDLERISCWQFPDD